MRFTDRDIRLVRDVILSRVLSRDQLIRLGYFTSVCRANARLLSLVRARVLQVLKTPFYGQHLYAAGTKAGDLAGSRVGGCALRSQTPQYVQHALAVTDTRIQLLARGYVWRFEAQIRHAFTWRGLSFDLRPDGAAIKEERVLFVEVDLGHTNQTRMRSRFAEYRAFTDSGEFKSLFGDKEASLLVVTTGSLRAMRLADLAPACEQPLFRVVAAKELGIELAGGWS